MNWASVWGSYTKISSDIVPMRTGKYKLLLVAILLLTYVGQSFAAAYMTCEPMAGGSSLSMQAATEACPDHAADPLIQTQDR